MEHHQVAIQWGNHDIIWMGAAAGSAIRVATELNSALQYNTLAIVENTYGIGTRDLIGFAQETYKGCTWFMPRSEDDAVKNRMDTLSKAHKAIAIIMFRLGGDSSSAGTRSTAWTTSYRLSILITPRTP